MKYARMTWYAHNGHDILEMGYIILNKGRGWI